MKKILIYLIALLFVFTSVSFAGQGNRKHDKRGPTQFERDQRDVRNYRKQHPPRRKYGPGYQERYHGHRSYHPHHYRGHWRSWKEWDQYYRHHRHQYKDRQYYWRNNQLYFEFETDEGRFVFSIGR